MFGDRLRSALPDDAAPLLDALVGPAPRSAADQAVEGMGHGVRRTVRRSVDRGVGVARTSLDLSKTAARTSVDTSVAAARWSPLIASLGLSAAFVVFGASSALASAFARIVVTPVRNHAENVEVLAVIDGDDGTQVILSADSETTAPGTYSLTFDGGASVARIGEIVSFDPRDGTVQRRVEQVYSGNLHAAARGRFTGFVYPTPADAGYAAAEVQVPVDNGTAPAWRVDPPAAENGVRRAGDGLWAIMVHGRGARRNEGIRAVRTAQKLGMTSLLVSYRNDGDAPAAEDGRYGLGTTEWRDVEAAIRYALAQGATDVVLFGWSMGGAVALQCVDRSELAHRVRAVVLTGPVVDWIDVLKYQARRKRIPDAVGLVGRWLMSNRAGRLVTGLAAPVDLKALNWVARAEQLRVPTLIMHSEDDDYVPVGPSMELAERNPDLVRFVRFTRARHTKEWNVDPRRWDHTARGWLRAVLNASRPGAAR